MTQRPGTVATHQPDDLPKISKPDPVPRLDGSPCISLACCLPEGREDHGAVVEDDPEAAEAARDDGVLLEPLDDGRGVAARGALEPEAAAVGEDGRVGRLRDPERRYQRRRRRRVPPAWNGS